MTSLSQAEKREASEALEMMLLAERHKRENKMAYYVPAPKQKEYFSMGLPKRERLFMAANGVGKSEAGAYEDACHLTGDYPEWWDGVRYEHPVKMWIACETGLLTRDVIQTKLCGKAGVVQDFGTGLIPKGRFADKPTLARGVTDAFDTIQVVHRTNGVTDGISTCSFKSYEQGRTKFQGENLDFGHCDEEPDMDIYSEFLARIRNSDDSRMSVTFTPLKGRTAIVERFEESHPDKGVVHMSLDEATWYSEDQKRKMIEGYPSHERDARRYGVPLLGSGKVFLYPESMLEEPFLEYVPPHWKKIWGVDFGVGHPFAAVLLLWDTDNDVIHVHQALRLKSDERTPWMAQPIFHAATMKKYGASVPVAWPQDGHQRDKGSGATIAASYKKAGLLMLPSHATFPDGGNSLEAGISEMDTRILTNRLKVSKHCAEWFEEYRFYHRDNGEIVKIKDDLLAATRYGMMMRRHARAVPLGSWERNKKDAQNRIADGVDFDVFKV
jgi:phage terminase large subunit-like protein